MGGERKGKLRERKVGRKQMSEVKCQWERSFCRGDERMNECGKKGSFFIIILC